jgi:hypothetical protein
MIFSATFDRLSLLGHEDDAHAAFADLFQELVGADRGAWTFGNRRANLGPRKDRKLTAKEASRF